jgi:hypothetical protein
MSLKDVIRKFAYGPKTDSGSYVFYLRLLGMVIGDDTVIYVPTKRLIDATRTKTVEGECRPEGSLLNFSGCSNRRGVYSQIHPSKRSKDCAGRSTKAGIFSSARNHILPAMRSFCRNLRSAADNRSFGMRIRILNVL